MLAPSFTTTIDGIVTHVDRYGVANSATELRTLSAHGRAHGVAPAVLDVLDDAAAPLIVRERAVAHVAAALRCADPAAVAAA
ncbi:MAG: hypothetical protein AAGG08_02210 [Actinomycetota bacterium]